MHWGDMQLPAKTFLISQNVLIQCGWVLYLSLGAWVYTNSVKVLKSWKYLKLAGKGEVRYMGKFRKSCKPVYIGYPGLLRIRKVSLLKYFQGVVRGTFRVLLLGHSG